MSADRPGHGSLRDELLDVVVREPNGNDYGKNLLAQHYARQHR